MTPRPKTSLYAAFLIGALVPGCGSNASEIPPELLEAIRRSERNADVGTRVGDVVENLCFDGFRNPRAAGFDPARFERICLYDFRDDPGGRLLLINSGAIWCAACRFEYDGGTGRPSLAEHLARREDRGFRMLGSLFEDAGGHPATPEDAALWASAFDVSFPFVLDASFQLGNFSVASQAPFNMLVELEEMRIVLQVQGDQPAVLYSRVDQFLDEAENK